ncbi:MAG: hypothetical protein ACXITR_01520 [Cyanobacterium sp.]
MDSVLVSDILGNTLFKIYSHGQLNQQEFINVSNDIFFDLILNQRQKTTITFNSSICFKLTKYYSCTPYSLATDFLEIYKNMNLKKYGNLMMNISGEGWLELTLDNFFLEEYLNNLLSFSFENNYINHSKIQADFKHIYIHSRFCSILRSAHEQRIITLDCLNFATNLWNILDFEEIKFSSLEFLITKDLGLIKSIIYCLELTKNNKSGKINYLKIVEKMFQALTAWEKNCRIWGAVKEENIDLAKARLGLSAIALRYYQNLCKSIFIEDLPTEL